MTDYSDIMRLDITRRGIVILRESVSRGLLKILEKRLTVKHYGFKNKITQLKSYQSDNKTKRHYLAHKKGLTLLYKNNIKYSITSKILPGESVDVPDGKLKLYDYQEDILAYLFKKVYVPQLLEIGMGSCIMSLKAGLGKSYIAMGLFARVKQKTLFISPYETLILQMVKDLQSVFPDVSVGYQYGKCKKDGDFVVSCPKSALSDVMMFKNKKGKKVTMNYKEWYERFGLIIIDEVHMMCSKSNMELFRRARAYYTLGMSATPNHRNDKMDKAYHNYLGKPIEMKDKIPALAKDPTDDIKLDVVRLAYNGPNEYTKACLTAEGSISVPMMVNQLCNDPNRFKLIVAEAIKLFKDGHCIFIFTDRRLYVAQLVKAINLMLPGSTPAIDSKYLEDKGNTSSINNIIAEFESKRTDSKTLDKVKSTALMGGCTDETREYAKHKGRITVATLQVGGTGVSFNRYTAIIFASPRRNGFEQFNNRIFRLGTENKRNRKIIYIVDNRTSLKGQYYGFTKAVKKQRPDTIFEKRTADWKDLEQQSLEDIYNNAEISE